MKAYGKVIFVSLSSTCSVFACRPFKIAELTVDWPPADKTRLYICGMDMLKNTYLSGTESQESLPLRYEVDGHRLRNRLRMASRASVAEVRVPYSFGRSRDFAGNHFFQCRSGSVPYFSIPVRPEFTAKSRGDVAQDSADVLPERDEGGYGRLLFRVVPVDAGQCDVAVLRGQFLKREADDDGCVVAYAELQKQGVFLAGLLHEGLVPLPAFVPMGVLDEVAVLAQVHVHRPAAYGATGNELGGDAAVRGVPGHLMHKFLIVIQAVVACSGALQPGIIALHGEDASTVEAGFLELSVHIGGDYGPVFPPDRTEKRPVQVGGRCVVAVQPDMSGPVGPPLLLSPEGEKDEVYMSVKP